MRPAPGKVFHPGIAPGMEKANDFAAIRIKPSDVGSFEAVAMDTSEGKILKFSRAPVLPRDDGLSGTALGEKPRAIGNTHSENRLAAKPDG